MANVTAADVNKLRKQTGAGMMDCKKALVEAEGNFDEAIAILRKKGQKIAAKRADRDATEGVAIAKINTENTVKTSGKPPDRQLFTIYLTTASLKRRDFVTYF